MTAEYFEYEERGPQACHGEKRVCKGVGFAGEGVCESSPGSRPLVFIQSY
jgi:hypothetical protein